MVLNMFDEVHIKGISKTDASNIILFCLENSDMVLGGGREVGVAAGPVKL
jgi:hypothetical protein